MMVAIWSPFRNKPAILRGPHPLSIAWNCLLECRNGRCNPLGKNAKSVRARQAILPVTGTQSETRLTGHTVRDWSPKKMALKQRDTGKVTGGCFSVRSDLRRSAYVNLTEDMTKRAEKRGRICS